MPEGGGDIESENRLSSHTPFPPPLNLASQARAPPPLPPPPPEIESHAAAFLRSKGVGGMGKRLRACYLKRGGEEEAGGHLPNKLAFKNVVAASPHAASSNSVQFFCNTCLGKCRMSPLPSPCGSLRSHSPPPPPPPPTEAPATHLQDLRRRS